MAKDQNVRLRSGWFSERSASYLASDKPVITEDTGFGNIFPVGEGLFAFSSEDQVVQAIDEINSNYLKHCDAARQIAREYFDARKVVSQFIDRLSG